MVPFDTIGDLFKDIVQVEVVSRDAYWQDLFEIVITRYQPDHTKYDLEGLPLSDIVESVFEDAHQAELDLVSGTL